MKQTIEYQALHRDQMIALRQELRDRCSEDDYQKYCGKARWFIAGQMQFDKSDIGQAAAKLLAYAASEGFIMGQAWLIAAAITMIEEQEKEMMDDLSEGPMA